MKARDTDERDEHGHLGIAKVDRGEILKTQASAAGWGRAVKELKVFARAADLAPGATATLSMKTAAGSRR